MLPKSLFNTLQITVAFVFFIISSQAFATVSVPSAPPLDAKSFILVDFDSNKVLAEKNTSAKLAPASLTKIMTAFVVFREINQGNLTLEETARISEKAWRTPGSRMFV